MRVCVYVIYFNTTENQQMETMWHKTQNKKTGPTDLINNSWEFRGSSSPRAVSVCGERQMRRTPARESHSVLRQAAPWCAWGDLVGIIVLVKQIEYGKRSHPNPVPAPPPQAMSRAQLSLQRVTQTLYLPRGPGSLDRDRMQPALAQRTGNCPPSENPWISSPCENCVRGTLARRHHQLRCQVSTRGLTYPNYLSHPLSIPKETNSKLH
jgi:hypothetical protein